MPEQNNAAVADQPKTKSDGTENYSKEQKASYNAGARKTAKQYGAMIAEKDAEIAQLKAELNPPQPENPLNQVQTAQQQAQQPQQPQQQSAVDPNLQRQMDDMKYNQQRQEAVDTYIADNSDALRLRGSVLELSKQPAYRDVPTQHLFNIAQAQNPEPATPPAVPSGQQVSNDTAMGNSNKATDPKTAINEERKKRAMAEGRPYDPIK